MNFQRYEAQVKQDEGQSLAPYLDTAEPPVASIGYGTTSISGKPVTLETPEISEMEATTLLRADLYQSVIDAQSLFYRFNQMDHVRQEVLANMAYNLGRARLAKFRKLIKAAETLNYSTMSYEMRESKWFRQVGERGKRLVRQMRTGRY